MDEEQRKTIEARWVVYNNGLSMAERLGMLVWVPGDVQALCAIIDKQAQTLREQEDALDEISGAVALQVTAYFQEELARLRAQLTACEVRSRTGS